MNSIDNKPAAIELPRALEGIAFFAKEVHKGKFHWGATLPDGHKIVVDKGCENIPPRAGFYAFRAHARTANVTFVNLTRADNGFAIAEELPDELELEFKLERDQPVAFATVYGTKCRVTLKALGLGNEDKHGIEAVRKCLGSRWRVVPLRVGTDFYYAWPHIVGRVIAEIISPQAMRRREKKVTHHHSLPVVVRGDSAQTASSPSSGEQASATA